MNSKEDLLKLLQEEQLRVNKRIRRHEDVMPDLELRELMGVRSGLRFALAQLEKSDLAA